MHHHYIDRFASGDSPVHRLDPRAKSVAIVAYSVCLISVGRYELGGLVPFAILPVVLVEASRIPWRFVIRRALWASPFVAGVALAGLLWDHSCRVVLGVTLPAGVVLASNVLLKFAFGMAALIVLVSTTPFGQLLAGLRRLGVPAPLLMQMQLLYRYLYLLIDQAMHIGRARAAREAGAAPWSVRIRAAGGQVGVLFVRTIEQAERVHHAMLARGFDGTFRSVTLLRFGKRDAAFLAAVAFYLAIARFGSVTWGFFSG